MRRCLCASVRPTFSFQNGFLLERPLARVAFDLTLCSFGCRGAWRSGLCIATNLKFVRRESEGTLRASHAAESIVYRDPGNPRVVRAMRRECSGEFGALRDEILSSDVVGLMTLIRTSNLRVPRVRMTREDARDSMMHGTHLYATQFT